MSTKKRKKRQKPRFNPKKGLIYADKKKEQEYAHILAPLGDKRFTAKLLNGEEKICKLPNGVAKRCDYIRRDKNQLVLIEPTSSNDTTVWRIETVYSEKQKKQLEKEGILITVDETEKEDLGFTFESEQKDINARTVDELEEEIDFDDL